MAFESECQIAWDSTWHDFLPEKIWELLKEYISRKLPLTQLIVEAIRQSSTDFMNSLPNEDWERIMAY